jgi:hypothetical protein
MSGGEDGDEPITACTLGGHEEGVHSLGSASVVSDGDESGVLARLKGRRIGGVGDLDGALLDDVSKDGCEGGARLLEGRGNLGLVIEGISNSTVGDNMHL